MCDLGQYSHWTRFVSTPFLSTELKTKMLYLNETSGRFVVAYIFCFTYKMKQLIGHFRFFFSPDKFDTILQVVRNSVTSTFAR
jgi:hypothetical protein